jgi:flagellar biosynthetic protein FliR
MDPVALMDFLGFTTGEMERMGLILARLSGIMAAAPFFSRAVGPMRIRAVLILLVTLLLFPLAPHWAGEGRGETGLLAGAVVSELAIGAIMGILIHWSLVAVQVAGGIMGFQMGLNMAEVMDPTSGIQQGVLSSLLYWMGLIIFLTMDGHHLILEGLARSLHSLPLGSGLPKANVILQSGTASLERMFRMGFILAAPLVVAAKMLYLGMGLINRASPQVQVFFVSMPIAQIMGFLLLGLTLMIFRQVLVHEIEAFFAVAFHLVGL